ncbi:MAG: DUF494 domain-containing protein [Burkholderiales bacterium]|nr:DUF494 domain-containing protein [Burkholderiales bacterium]
MLDILQYLYDHYLVDDHLPDQEALARKLATVGFDQGEIAQALEWLEGLTALDPQAETGLTHDGLRVYNADELNRIAPEGRGFLSYLENAGLLSPYAREWVVERALALDEPEVPADKVKWIALLALWRLGGALSALWLEDLVRGDEAGAPTLH